MEIRSNMCANDGQTKVWPTGTPEPEHGLSWGDRVGYTVFSKPDTITRSPKVNGYRMPTNYSAGVNEVNILAELSGNGTTPGGYYQFKNEGSVAMWLKDLSILKQTLNPNEIRMKIRNNIKDEVLDVAMVLAEMQSTATTLGNNLLRVGRSLQAIKNRKRPHYDMLMHGRRPRLDGPKAVDKFNREVAGTYLEWKYGIMPTIYDIQGACAGLDLNAKGSLFDNPPLLVARASSRTNRTVSAPFVGNGVHFSVNADVKCNVQEELKARCDFRVSGEGLRGLNRYGLGLGTIATIGFERTPFSFVLNMALPIAELIKAWTALSGASVISYCETSHVKVKVISGRATGYYYGPIEGPIKPVDDFIRFNRIALREPPMPVPFVRNPIKVGNIATVLALFTQLRR